jgi:hypothetical protein
MLERIEFPAGFADYPIAKSVQARDYYHGNEF